MPENKGVLYLCATPIGNLEDITLRVLRVLKEADLIAAEDTRHTRKLLSYYDLHTPLTSYHEHNKKEKGRQLLAMLQEGKSIALVSDAGTPGISDPGQDMAVLALAEGIIVVPVPGVSAMVTAVMVSGLPSDRIVFEAFLPRVKKDRARIMEQLAAEERTVVLYESPHRVLRTLTELRQVCGDRRVAVARELTKVHEEIIRGEISSVLSHFETRPPRGEFCIIMEGYTPAQEEAKPLDTGEIYELVRELLANGLNKKEAIKEVAAAHGLSKRQVYSAVIEVEDKY